RVRGEPPRIAQAQGAGDPGGRAQRGLAGLDGGRLSDQGGRPALRWLRHPAVYWVVSIGLGAVFIYASLDKIAHPLDFARIVYRYRLAGPAATPGGGPAHAF